MEASNSENELVVAEAEEDYSGSDQGKLRPHTLTKYNHILHR